MQHIIQRDQLDKRIIDTIEIGETKSRLNIGNDGVRKDYFVYLNFTFSYADKQGELTGVAFQRAGVEAKFECDGVGENITSTLEPIIVADFPLANDAQRADIESEIIEYIQGQCSRFNWVFFPTAYDKQTYYETE